MYIVEISPTVAKGLFGSLNQLAVTFGVLGIDLFGIGDKIPYYYLPLVPMVLILVFIMLATFLKETPRWLVSKGRTAEAAVVLTVLQGVNVEEELEGLKTAIQKESGDCYGKVIFFGQKPAYLALFFSVFLMAFQQVCGINAIIFFASDILKRTQVSVSTLTIESTIGISVIQVIFTLVAVLIVDLVGRKLLLIIGSCGSLISTLVLGVYFLMDDLGTQLTSVLPIICMAVFIISFSLGWGPIPWVMVNEFSPIKVRAIIAGVSTAVNWAFAALVTGIFDIGPVKEHLYYFWFLFAAMSFLSIFFVLLLPETKGKSLQVMESDLRLYKMLKCSMC